MQPLLSTSYGATLPPLGTPLSDPLWSLASAIPWLGANFSATAEIARSADDVATLGVAPLVKVYDSLNWDKLMPSASGTDLEPIRKAAPAVASAAHAVRVSAERLNGIDAGSLLPQIAGPLTQARQQLGSVVDELDTASDVAGLAPGMLGSDKPRHYLLLVQNNAEARATGGIPGALVVLTADKGKISLSAESSATELGAFNPPVSGRRRAGAHLHATAWAPSCRTSTSPQTSPPPPPPR